LLTLVPPVSNRRNSFCRLETGTTVRVFAVLPKRFLLVLLAMATSSVLTGCQPGEKISQAKRPRLNDLHRLLAAVVPEPPYTFRAPDGWTQVPATSNLYVLSFVTRDKDTRADINVSFFQGKGGGVLANVNRWRDQLKLPPLSPAKADALPEIAIGNAKGTLVDFTGPDAPSQQNRILGAILIQESNAFFFKMTGPSSFLARQQPAFEAFLKSFEVHKTWTFRVVDLETKIDALVGPLNQFVQSIKFSAGKPTWTLPAGWTEGKAQRGHYATIYAGPKGEAPAVVVTELAPEQVVPAKDYVNGWRAQLGLKGLDVLDLEDFFQDKLVDGRLAILVDMVGPNNQQQEREVPEPPFAYKTPPGWREIPPTSTFYVLSFVAVDKDKRADINVSVMPGDGGGLAANVNRWRAQVGLGALNAAEVNALRDIAIGTTKGKLVDATGATAPAQRNRVLGAILIHENDSLFFKMTGPKEFVEQQLPAFETFLKSIQFTR
jgi:hypothetical protein